MLAGLVAMVLNLILPQEDKPLEENHDAEHVEDNVEKGSTHKNEGIDV